MGMFSYENHSIDDNKQGTRRFICFLILFPFPSVTYNIQSASHLQTYNVMPMVSYNTEILDL